eukprot:1156475-Pelagomonas_calceolata.AAC.1
MSMMIFFLTCREYRGWGFQIVFQAGIVRDTKGLVRKTKLRTTGNKKDPDAYNKDEGPGRNRDMQAELNEANLRSIRASCFEQQFCRILEWQVQAMPSCLKQQEKKRAAAANACITGMPKKIPSVQVKKSKIMVLVPELKPWEGRME